MKTWPNIDYSESEFLIVWSVLVYSSTYSLIEIHALVLRKKISSLISGLWFEKVFKCHSRQDKQRLVSNFGAFMLSRIRQMEEGKT